MFRETTQKDSGVLSFRVRWLQVRWLSRRRARVAEWRRESNDNSTRIADSRTRDCWCGAVRSRVGDLTNLDRDCGGRRELVDGVLRRARPSAGCGTNEHDRRGSTVRGEFGADALPIERSRRYREARGRCHRQHRCGIGHAAEREQPCGKHLGAAVGPELCRVEADLGDDERCWWCGRVRRRCSLGTHDSERIRRGDHRIPRSGFGTRWKHRGRDEGSGGEGLLRVVRREAGGRGGDRFAQQYQWSRCNIDRKVGPRREGRGGSASADA